MAWIVLASTLLLPRSSDDAEACVGSRLGALDVRVGPTPQPTESSVERAKLVPVDLVVEQFLGDKCGFACASQAALRSHQSKMHFEDDEKTQRQTEIQSSREGMCVNMPKMVCLHVFVAITSLTWPAFTYHVNSRSCPETRRFYGDPELCNVLADLSSALVARDSILTAAVDTAWKELALLPEVRKHHNHCLECHRWSAQPQYVRRHMIAKHKDLVPVVCSQFIQEQDFGLISPCKYRGLGFKQRRAHLKSCAGIFNGVYLCKRIARSTGAHGRPQGGHAGAGLDSGLATPGCSRKPGANTILDLHVDGHRARKDAEHLDDRSPNGAGARAKAAQRSQGARTINNHSVLPNGKTGARTAITSKKKDEQIGHLQSQVSVLTTLLLRHESQ